jgi:hypothetical protein
MNDEIKIIDANLVKDYIIKITFNDNTVQMVNFGPFLESSRHPEIRKYLDKKLFKQFKIVNGDLDWNNYDLIFPIADLYENSIVKISEQKAA